MPWTSLSGRFIQIQRLTMIDYIIGIPTTLETFAQASTLLAYAAINLMPVRDLFSY